MYRIRLELVADDKDTVISQAKSLLDFEKKSSVSPRSGVLNGKFEYEIHLKKLNAEEGREVKASRKEREIREQEKHLDLLKLELKEIKHKVW